MNYIDLHCDTLDILRTDDKKPFITTDFLIKNNCLAQCFAVFIKNSGKSDAEFKFLKNQISLYYNFLGQNNGILRGAESGLQILKNKMSGMISAVLTVENGDFIGDDFTRIGFLKTVGVKMLTLLWNNENCIGHPASEIRAQNLTPLKENGKKTIKLLNQNNIIIDVSHLNEGGFWDVARLSTRPFIASHSCCTVLHRHRRNLSDSQIKAIHKSGGVIGINFYNEFINGGLKPTDITDIIKQAEHIIKLTSPDAVALGSDLDGIPHNIDFGFPEIHAAVSSYFGADVADKILFKNAFRMFDY